MGSGPRKGKKKKKTKKKFGKNDAITAEHERPQFGSLVVDAILDIVAPGMAARRVCPYPASLCY